MQLQHRQRWRKKRSEASGAKMAQTDTFGTKRHLNELKEDLVWH